MIVALAVAGAAPASACIIPPPPASAMLNISWDAVVVGVVEHAEYTTPEASSLPAADRPWQGTATALLSVEGSIPSNKIQFGDKGDAEIVPLCGEWPRYEAPRRGEQWVFYYRRRGSALELGMFRPLGYAVQHDRRFRSTKSNP
ncbi:hypothetical protein GCM10023325_00090 [Sphingomonas lutea]